RLSAIRYSENFCTQKSRRASSIPRFPPAGTARPHLIRVGGSGDGYGVGQKKCGRRKSSAARANGIERKLPVLGDADAEQARVGDEDVGRQAGVVRAQEGAC